VGSVNLSNLWREDPSRALWGCSAGRPQTLATPRRSALASCLPRGIVRHAPHTVGPARIYAWGAGATTTLPLTVYASPAHLGSGGQPRNPPAEAGGCLVLRRGRRHASSTALPAPFDVPDLRSGATSSAEMRDVSGAKRRQNGPQFRQSLAQSATLGAAGILMISPLVTFKHTWQTGHFRVATFGCRSWCCLDFLSPEDGERPFALPVY
jgi:hypothetical protein